MRRVPLATRNLLHDPRRALLSLGAVTASMLLVMVLDGVFNGAMLQVTSYIRHSPAQLFVAQDGVTTMHMTTSALDPYIAEEVTAVDGVAWVEGLHFTTSTLDAERDSMLTYVLGYDIDHPVGGPRRITAGAPPGPGGAVIDEAAAEELSLRVGDDVALLGATFRIDGLITGGTYIANTTTYIRADDFARLRGDTVAYLLIGIREGADADAVRDAVAAAVPGSNVMTRAQFAREEGDVVRSMAADVMLIMSAVGFLISLCVIGLTLFTATIAKQREYGVLKAIGAPTSRLAGILVAQAAILVIVAAVAAALSAMLLGGLITWLEPNVQVAITPRSVMRATVAGLGAASLAVLLPLRRLARVDAATAFRRI